MRTVFPALLIWALFSISFTCTYAASPGSDHDLLAASRPRKYIITASAGEGGEISPSGEVKVDRDKDITFSISANEGYEIEDVLVDGVSQGPISSYKFRRVKSDHTITATFYKNGYFISASAGPGGEIAPEGTVVVAPGGSQAFDIKAKKEYNILDIEVDGLSVGPLSTYTFSNVSSDHSITATFSLKTYTITSSAGAGGSITPAGEVIVEHDKDQSFQISPDGNNEILDVEVDGESKGAITSYKFTKVKSDHSISATFNRNFGVLNVTIPNTSMKIGDVISASLDIDDDQGNAYSLVSGSVGGYPLTGLQRISNTSYRAEFTILQGGNSYLPEQDIPVANLVISNGEDVSIAYNLPIIQNNDPLDAELPVVHSMRIAGGNLKIGDVLVLEIESDGLNYNISPLSRINGLEVTASNISFMETGGGSYELRYTIQEGDTEVGEGWSEFEATIILAKPSGNMGMPYSTVINASNLTIDAHAPVITLMEVPDMEVGVGGMVIIKVSADGTAYTAGPGTMVNGVSLSSPRVTINEISAGQYELIYQVAPEDMDASPGTLQTAISFTDAAGNSGNTFTVLEPNSLEVYTALPEAVFGVIPEICEGEETELSVFFTGKSPWSFDLDDGSSTKTHANISSSIYKISVAPELTTTYRISVVTDVNGVENRGISETVVQVHESEELEILNLATGYNVEDDPVKLEANFPGGTFSGPGVFSESAYFYPSIADTVHSPHTIYYTFENSNNCSSVTSKVVHVLGAGGAVLIPEDVVCSKNNPFIARVMNVPGIIGTFRLLNSDAEPVSGLEDHGDNTATIDPAMLNSEKYTIEYQYVDQVSQYLRKDFHVESVSEPQILTLDDSLYCQNAASFDLRSNVTDVVFEGSGVSGNMEDGFTFNPLESSPGNIPITCTAYSENGCMASVQEHITVLFSPMVNFGISSECLPEDGEIVSFDNLTNGKSDIETWEWNFGDSGSGQNNFSSLVHPTHHYQEPGLKTVSLTATTEEGCVASYELVTLIDSKPQADFTWTSDCYTHGSEVKFINISSHGSAQVDTILWTFSTSEGDVLGRVGSKSPSDTVAFPFSKADNYQVSLYAQNEGGCSSEKTKDLLLITSIQLDGEGYSESFDASEGLWTVGAEGQTDSWVWGIPDFMGFSHKEGDNAWFTRLPAGTGSIEHSWIQSPCFDFTNMERPLIQLDVLRSFAPDLNGAVLQYRDENEGNWNTVGEDTPGIGWYNISEIKNKPGGSTVGWGLDAFNPDTEWVRAVHDLDQVAGKSNVIFRVALASNGKQDMNNQGFAFNNVVLAERTKIAVLEHFTSNASHVSRLADDYIDDFASTHARDVIDLQYHLDVGGKDPMHQNNPGSSDIRSFNYGTPQIPYTVLDGGMYPDHRYDLSILDADQLEDDLRRISLEIPAFCLDLTLDWQGTGLEAYTELTCMTDRFENFIQLYLVVFETSVTAYTGGNGDTHFRNVVLDMLPTPAGTLLENNWSSGKSDVRTHLWNYMPYVEDIDDLAVAAFIQDRATGQILQATVEYKDKRVGTRDPESVQRGMFIYPNPTQRLLYVNLGNRAVYAGRLELVDVNGRIVFSEQIPPGYQLFQLDMNHLNQGIYFLRWIEAEQTRETARVVKTH